MSAHDPDHDPAHRRDTARRVDPHAAVDLLVAQVRRLHSPAEPRGSGTGTEPASRAARGVLVVVDGATGSGKSTLARALVGALGHPDTASGPVLLVEADRFVPGWDSLDVGVRRCTDLLTGLERDGRARVPRWDWSRARPDTDLEAELPEGGVVVIEGCGTLAAAARPLERLHVLRVLVEAPRALRRARISARDAYVWDVDSWEEQEETVAGAWRNGRFGPDLLVRAPTSRQER